MEWRINWRIQANGKNVVETETSLNTSKAEKIKAL